MSFTRFWDALFPSAPNRSTPAQHLFGAVIIVLALAVILGCLSLASTFYAKLVNNDWSDWRDVAWIVLCGVVIIAVAAMENETVRGGWNGRFAWICGFAYFGLPIICNGLARTLDSEGLMPARADQLFSWRHMSGVVGTVWVFALYYATPVLTQWWKERRVKRRRARMRTVDPGVGGRQANRVPRIPPRPYDRYTDTN